MLIRTVAVLCLLALTAGGVVRADSCAECKARCNTSEAMQTCLSEANEPGGFAGCGVGLASCIARCTCPDPGLVQQCIAAATKRHSDRALACLRQFPTNPTGCGDRNNRNYESEVANCKVSP